MAYFSQCVFFCVLLYLPLHRTLGGSHFISSQFKVFLPRSYRFQFHHFHVSFFFVSIFDFDADGVILLGCFFIFTFSAIWLMSRNEGVYSTRIFVCSIYSVWSKEWKKLTWTCQDISSFFYYKFVWLLRFAPPANYTYNYWLALFDVIVIFVIFFIIRYCFFFRSCSFLIVFIVYKLFAILLFFTLAVCNRDINQDWNIFNCTEERARREWEMKERQTLHILCRVYAAPYQFLLHLLF